MRHSRIPCSDQSADAAGALQLGELAAPAAVEPHERQIEVDAVAPGVREGERRAVG